jgi:hypothetical protein
VVEPNDANRALYDAGFAHQMELLEAARPLWHTRAAGTIQRATQGDKK